MASTTFIDNQTTIYASWLNDVNTAVYTGVFPNGSLSLTTLNVTGAVSGAGFTSLINNTLSAPGAIGSATPNTGAFTTLSATAVTATSITGLTTPLSRAQGGTGLFAVGTAGNVLTSDGTNWASSASQSIGIGQTWQSVTRTAGVTYTNTTGRPIMLVLNQYVNNTSASGWTITIDGLLVTNCQGAAAGIGMAQGISSTNIIPPSSTYVVGGTGAPNAYELR